MLGIHFFDLLRNGKVLLLDIALLHLLRELVGNAAAVLRIAVLLHVRSLPFQLRVGFQLGRLIDVLLQFRDLRGQQRQVEIMLRLVDAFTAGGRAAERAFQTDLSAVAAKILLIGAKERTLHKVIQARLLAVGPVQLRLLASFTRRLSLFARRRGFL